MNAAGTPVVTMSTLGRKGRFGNQIFQYAFLKIYAKVFNLRVETPKWIGRYLFGHNDPPISNKLTVLREEEQSKLQSIFTEPIPRYVNVDFLGYYQFHTSYFAPYRDFFRSLFTPVPPIKTAMEKALSELLARGKTIIGLHIRRGDYKRYKGTNKKDVFYVAPVAWYKDWLSSVWGKLNDPVLFIASDEIEVIAPKFAEYQPITAKDIYGVLPKAEFYPDHYMLTHCDILATSNSTFSFTASMLNQKAKSFLRPDLEAETLVHYDPWASLPLLNRVRSFY